MSGIALTYKPGKNPTALSHKATGLFRSFRNSPVLFFFALILSQYDPAIGQDSLIYQRITIRDTTLSVQQVFQLISKYTALNFSYNPEVIDLSKTVHVAAENESLHSILDRILQDPALEYRIIGRQIVIFKPLVIKQHDIHTLPDRNPVVMLEIKGRILDRHNRDPIPFANIYLVGKSTGTIANLQGDFLLKLSSDHLQDSLVVSSMGYEKLIMPVTYFMSGQQDYYLKTDIIPIQEVIIRKKNPLLLLTNAIENIRVNYPLYPTLLTSFYREIISKNNRIMSVSEAILQTYKTAYILPVTGDQIKIIKGRKTREINSSDTLIMKLKAGLNTTLLLDIVKNLPEFLTEENFPAYSYQMTDIIVNDQDDLYVIRFSPKEGYPRAIYKGRIFLNIQNLAITAVEFEVDPLKMEEATDMFVLKKPRYIKVKPQMAQYRVTFRKIEDRYYLNLIRCETSFRVRYKNQLFGSVYRTILEMAVTQIENNDIERFRIKEAARSQEIFMEQITDYEDSFWDEFNFIKPEEPLEEAMKRLGGE
ncbi:MAG: carboxypeptidase-like regulatory domain-containing protein [Bacteroidales bacterium]|nr:carboxypeptidase-like regulatory domain-containing protein [Bacteroidales bacterium]